MAKILRASETFFIDCCTVFNRCYAYDKAGNLIQSADQRSGVLNYVYDKIGRIQEAANKITTTKMEDNLIQKRKNGNGAFSWKSYKDNVTEQHRK